MTMTRMPLLTSPTSLACWLMLCLHSLPARAQADTSDLGRRMVSPSGYTGVINTPSAHVQGWGVAKPGRYKRGIGMSVLTHASGAGGFLLEHSSCVMKVLSDGVILRSEACLVRARKPEHEGNAMINRIIEAVRGAL